VVGPTDLDGLVEYLEQERGDPFTSEIEGRIVRTS
jgi:hypothetical protein